MPTIGALYHFKGLRGRPDADGKPTWAFPPGVYRYLGQARDYRMERMMILYQGADGPDEGKFFLACRSDWDRDFTLMGETNG